MTYDSTSFIADMGGSLGFLLGLSVLSAVEIAEWVIYNMVTLVKKWRRKRMVMRLKKHACM